MARKRKVLGLGPSNDDSLGVMEEITAARMLANAKDNFFVEVMIRAMGGGDPAALASDLDELLPLWAGTWLALVVTLGDPADAWDWDPTRSVREQYPDVRRDVDPEGFVDERGGAI